METAILWFMARFTRGRAKGVGHEILGLGLGGGGSERRPGYRLTGL